jgi:hypothetical protein
VFKLDAGVSIRAGWHCMNCLRRQIQARKARENADRTQYVNPQNNRDATVSATAYYQHTVGIRRNEKHSEGSNGHATKWVVDVHYRSIQQSNLMEHVYHGLLYTSDGIHLAFS